MFYPPENEHMVSCGCESEELKTSSCFGLWIGKKEEDYKNSVISLYLLSKIFHKYLSSRWNFRARDQTFTTNLGAITNSILRGKKCGELIFNDEGESACFDGLI